MRTDLTRWLIVAIVVGGAYWLATVMAAQGFGVGVALAAMVAMLAVLVYGTARAVRLKYLVPTLLVTLGLQVWPLVFTAGIAFTNYAPGRALTQAAAAHQIVTESVRPVAGGARYEMTLAVPAGQSPRDGPLVMLLVDPNGRTLVAHDGELRELPEGVERAPSGRIAEAPGYDVLTVAEREARAGDVERLAVLTGQNTGVRALNLYEAAQGAPTFWYDDASGILTEQTNQTGQSDQAGPSERRTFRALDGRFVASDGSGQTLQPDWLEGVGLNNFTALLTQAPLRSAFWSTLAWNLVFAVLACAGALLLGASMAVALSQRTMAGRRAYQMLLLTPYVVPIFVAALAWRDLFHPEWLDTVSGARIAVLLAAWWVGAPVMLLFSAKAIRDFPPEVAQAARLDGASLWQTLTRIRLPVFLTTLTPLLLAAFSVYFNHFPIVYLITGGGPFEAAVPAAAGPGSGLGTPVTLGATDLLVTVAYRLAFTADTPSYGVAAAVFVIALVVTALLVNSVLWAQRVPRGRQP